MDRLFFFFFFFFFYLLYFESYVGVFCSRFFYPSLFPLFSFSRVGRLADVVVVVVVVVVLVVDGWWWCARSFVQNLSLVCDDDFNDDVAR